MKKENELLGRVLDYLSTVKHEQPKWQQDKTRCGWADAIILSFVNAIECLESCKAFYHGKECRQLTDLLSSYMERPATLWKKAHEPLEKSSRAFWEKLASLFGKAREPFGKARELFPKSSRAVAW